MGTRCIPLGLVCFLAISLAVICLVVTATASSSLPWDKDRVQVYIKVRSPLADANHLPPPPVSGGMVWLNMSAYAPISHSANILVTLPAGRHRLSLDHPHWIFPDLLVTVPFPLVQSSLTPLVVMESSVDKSNRYLGKSLIPAPISPTRDYPYTTLTWTATDQRHYFETRQGFNPLSMLKSPMLLMPLVSLGLVALLPKLSAMLEDAKNEEGCEKRDEQSPLAKYFKSL